MLDLDSGLKSMRSFFFCDPRFSKPQFPQSKMQMQAKDPKGKDYPRNFVSGIGVKGLILSRMAVFLPSLLLLLLSLVKL